MDWERWKCVKGFLCESFGNVQYLNSYFLKSLNLINNTWLPQFSNIDLDIVNLIYRKLVFLDRMYWRGHIFRIENKLSFHSISKHSLFATNLVTAILSETFWLNSRGEINKFRHETCFNITALWSDKNIQIRLK
jgi:hypothetical protein